MQLKIQRSQRVGGALGATVFFCLDVRADYSPEERDNIRKYHLAGQVIYSSQAAKRHEEAAQAHLKSVNDGVVGELLSKSRGLYAKARAALSLNISIGSLGRGHHIECKDMGELIEAEETVRTACKGVTQFLEVAKTFNGGEVVIEYDRGEERVKLQQASTPLLTVDITDASAPSPQIRPAPAASLRESPDLPQSEREPSPLVEMWLNFEEGFLESDFGKRRMISRHQIRMISLIVAALVGIWLISVIT